MEGKRYDKRLDLIYGLKGITYQLALLMYYAYDACKRELQFELLTEAKDYDGFDDIVIHYENHTEVIQVKHGSHKESYLSLFRQKQSPNEAADGIRVESINLKKYFDAWRQIKQKPHAKKIIFKLVSNKKLDFKYDNKDYNADAAIYDHEKGKFSANFIQGNNLDIDYLRKKRIEIFEDLKNKNLAITDKCIKQFLQEFTLEMGMMKVQELENHIRTDILADHGYFGTELYEAFYRHMLIWFRDENKTQNNVTINEFIAKTKARLPHYYLVGITKNYMARKLSHLPRGLYNITDYSKLANFLKGSNRQSLYITGESILGKAALLQDFLCHEKLLDGSYFFIKGKLLRDEQSRGQILSAFKGKHLKLVILDQADGLLENRAAMKAIKASIPENIKIIYLCASDKNVPNNQLFTLPALTSEQIAKISKNFSTTNFTLFGKKFSFAILKDTNQSALYAVTQNLDHYFTAIEPQAILGKKQEAAPFVAPNIFVKTAVYSLKEIIEANASVSTIQIKLTADNNIDKLYKYLKAFIPEIEHYSSKIIEDIPIMIDMLNIDKVKVLRRLRESASSKKRIIIFNDDVSIKIEDALKLELINPAEINQNKAEKDDEEFICVIDEFSLINFPEPINFRKTPLENLNTIQPSAHLKILQRNHSIDNRIVLFGNPGTGKSRLGRELQSAWQSNNAFDSECYSLVFTLSLPKIPQNLKINSEDDSTEVLCLLVNQMLFNGTLPEWQISILRQAFHNREVFMIYDALDEVTPTQYESHDAILGKIFKYSQFILTTRPNTRLPFIPTLTWVLDNFSNEQVNKLIKGYHSQSKHLQQEDLTDLIAKLPNQAKIYELLKTPLNCLLFCESLKNEYITGKVNLAALTRVKLYQNFIRSKLSLLFMEKYSIPAINIDDDCIHNFGHLLIKRIAHAAYHQLGLGSQKYLAHDPKIESDIKKLGLVKLKHTDQGILFNYLHQTMEEFFAALYIAIGLGSKKNRAKFAALVKEQRYDPRFSVIWQFLASLLLEGDLFIKDAQAGLDAFCSILVAGPQDLLGHRHVTLMQNIFVLDDLHKIKVHKDYFSYFLKNLAINRTTPAKVIPRAARFSTATTNEEKKSLSQQELYDEYIVVFKGFGFDQRGNDRIRFMNARENLANLTDMTLIKAGVRVLLEHNYSIDVSPVQIANEKLIRMGVLSNWSQRCELGVEIECEIIEALTKGFKSDAQAYDISYALENLHLRSEQALTLLKEKIAVILKPEIFSSAVSCLKISNLAVKEIYNLINKIFSSCTSKQLNVAIIKELFKLSSDYSKVNCEVLLNKLTDIVDSSTVTEIFKLAITYFEHLNEVTAKKFVQAILELINRESSFIRHYIESFIEFIEKTFIEKLFAAEYVTSKLISLAKNSSFTRGPIIGVLLKHRLFTEEVCKEFLSINIYPNATCNALLQLPTNRITDTILEFIVNNSHADNFANNLQTLIKEKAIALDRFPQKMREDICQKIISQFEKCKSVFLNFTILVYFQGYEKAISAYIETVPRASIVSPSPDVKIISQLTPSALDLVWKQLLQAYKKQPLAETWAWKILADYIKHYQIAVVIVEENLILYSLQGQIKFAIPNTKLQSEFRNAFEALCQTRWPRIFEKLKNAPDTIMDDEFMSSYNPTRMK